MSDSRPPPLHQLKYWSVTLHCGADRTRDAFLSWCGSTLPPCVRDEPQIADMIWQAEETADGGLHLQGFLQTSSRLYLAQVKDLLRTVGFPASVHLDPASNSGKEALKRYAMKEARVAGPWAKNARRLAELLKKQQDEKEFEPYKGEDLPRDLIPWQENLRRYLLGEVNNREVIVSVDEAGGAGKTTFCKYMAFHHHAGILSYGRANDLLYNVTQMSRIPKIMLVDLTRAKPDEIGDNELWSAIEQIKNGLVVCNKYKSVTITFPPPHVVVFTNSKPNPAVLSSDRWNVSSMSVRDRPRVQGVRRTFKWDVVYELPGAAALAASVPSRAHRIDHSEEEIAALVADFESADFESVVDAPSPPPSPVPERKYPLMQVDVSERVLPASAAPRVRVPSPVPAGLLLKRRAADVLPDPRPRAVARASDVPEYTSAMRGLYSIGYWSRFPSDSWPPSLKDSIANYEHLFGESPSSSMTHAAVDSEIEDYLDQVDRGVRPRPAASAPAAAAAAGSSAGSSSASAIMVEDD